MQTVRTHYLRWEPPNDSPESQEQLRERMDFFTERNDEGFLRRVRAYWDAGEYEAGAEEPESPAFAELDDNNKCEALWLKYNADDRPDGQQRRSMSVGDIVQIGDRYYVAGYRYGWLRLP